MKKYIIIAVLVLSIAAFWLILYGNKPTTLEEAIELELPYYDKKEVIHIERIGEFALVISKANPNDLTNHNIYTDYTIPVIDTFIGNDKDGWSLLNSSWQSTDNTEDLTYFIRTIPGDRDLIITFGDILNTDIKTVELKVNDEFVPANIVEDYYGINTYFLIHNFETRTIVRGYSEHGDIIYEIQKRY